jgi:hypothetical protein
VTASGRLQRGGRLVAWSGRNLRRAGEQTGPAAGVGVAMARARAYHLAPGGAARRVERGRSRGVGPRKDGRATHVSPEPHSARGLAAACHPTDEPLAGRDLGTRPPHSRGRAPATEDPGRLVRAGRPCPHRGGARRLALVARGRGDRIVWYDTPAELDAFNARVIRAGRRLGLRRVLRGLAAARALLLRGRLPATALADPAHALPVTRWLRGFAWTHEGEHRRKVRAWERTAAGGRP